MKDFLLVSIIGFLVGWLILPIAVNFNFKITPLFILGSVIGFTIFAPLMLAIIYGLSRFWPVLRQFGRFAAVGTLNTLLDISVLNLLIYFTGFAAGLYFSLFKAISFLVATTNSYFWNKFWTFQSKTLTNFAEYFRFAVFTFIGVLLNNGTASFLVNIVGPKANFSPIAWANLAALLAVAVSFLWNFCSYRYIIFSARGGSALGGKNQN
jgi:putative flippase GtrA